MKRILISMMVAMAMLLALVAVPAGPASAAGTLTSVSATVDPTTADTDTKMTVVFTTVSEIGNSGKILIEADDFTWADDTTVENTTVNALTPTSVAASLANKQVLIVIGAAETIAASIVVTVTLGVNTEYVTNPASEGNYRVDITTKTSADVAIDSGYAMASVGGAELDEPTVTLVLTGGTTSGTTSVTTGFTGITLTGASQTGTKQCGTPGTGGGWYVVDNSGDGLGWTVQVSVPLGKLSSSSHDLTLAASLAYNQVVVRGKVDDDNANYFKIKEDESSPTTGIEGTTSDEFVTLSTSDTTILAAGADEGLGSYWLWPEFEIQVPAGAYSGSYSLTLSVTTIFEDA